MERNDSLNMETNAEETVYDRIFSAGKIQIENQDAEGGFQAEPITERIFRIHVPGNVCAFLAIGEEKAALIDTGYGVGSIKAYVKSLTDKPLIVILTHAHFDHVGGASEFDFSYVPEKDLELTLAHSDKKARVQGLFANGVETTEEELTAPLKREQLIPYQPEAEFELGGYTVKMLPLYGHTKGSHCALFIQDRVLLLGDACNSFAFLQIEGSAPIEEYRDGLIAFKEKYDDLYDTLIYSHPHNFGDKTIIDEMIRLCTDILAPDYPYVDVEAIYGTGVCMAKPIDEAYRNLDGTAANILYRKDYLRKDR